jgi:transcriptional regulator with XRE-family HTH domain
LTNLSSEEKSSSEWRIRRIRIQTNQLARTVKENKEKRDRTIKDMWLACYTQEEIAETVGCTHQAVSEVLQKQFHDTEIAKPAPNYQDDFEAPIYNIWKQQNKTEGSKHFGNSEVRWVDNLLYLYTNLAEGCRDPLVVWREENVLVDGHHRFEICERHGIPFHVVYRSFPDIQAVKVWTITNQLSRRNLDKTERNQWIKELRAEGWTQKEIAEATKFAERSVRRVINEENCLNIICGQMSANKIQTITTPTKNLEEIIAERLKKEQQEAERQLAEERRKHEARNWPSICASRAGLRSGLERRWG